MPCNLICIPSTVDEKHVQRETTLQNTFSFHLMLASSESQLSIYIFFIIHTVHVYTFLMVKNATWCMHSILTQSGHVFIVWYSQFIHFMFSVYKSFNFIFSKNTLKMKSGLYIYDCINDLVFCSVSIVQCVLFFKISKILKECK